jgi:hypothetical protein
MLAARESRYYSTEGIRLSVIIYCLNISRRTERPLDSSPTAIYSRSLSRVFILLLTAF